MNTYFVLITFTPQGIRSIEESPARAEKFAQSLKASGMAVKGLYWTFGAYDGVVLLEAPDEASAHAAILSLAKAGNVQTQTLRAYDRDAMNALVARLT